MVDFPPKLRQPLNREKVKFSRDTKLSDNEKQKRSAEAYEFLKASSYSNISDNTRARSMQRSSAPLKSSDRYSSSRDPLSSSSYRRSLSIPITESSYRSRDIETPKSILKNKSSYREKRSHELIGESPIRSIPNADRFKTDKVLDSIKTKQYRPNISNYKVSKPAATPSQNYKPSHNGIINSLTSIGSRLLSSVLYNENESITKDKPILANTDPSALKSWNERELNRMSNSVQNTSSSDNINQNRSYTSDISSKRNELNSIEREIEARRLERELELQRLEKEIEARKLERELESSRFEKESKSSDNSDLDFGDKFKNMEELIKGFASESKETVLKELGSIKDEVLNLRKRQDRNNVEFESRLESLKHERELNKRSFERMMNELEEKREELDKEKDKYIKLLQKQNRKRKYRYSDDDTGDDDENEDRDKDSVELNGYLNDNGNLDSGYQRPGHKKRKVDTRDIKKKFSMLVDNVRDMQKEIQDNVNDTKQVNKAF